MFAKSAAAVCAATMLVGGAATAANATAQSAPESASTAVAVAPQGITTNSAGVTVNVRQNANTSSAVMWKYTGPTKIAIQCKVGGQAVDGNTTWYRLTSMNKTGYIAARYVRLTAGAPATCPPPVIPTGISTNPGGAAVYVRQAPSTSSTVLWKYAAPTKMTINCKTAGQTVNGNSTWYRLIAGTKTGYVSAAYVKLLSGSPNTCPAPAPTTGGFALRNNYPYPKELNPKAADPWGFYKRQCTSWAAFAVRDRLGVPFTNRYKSSTNWGDAKNWYATARRVGVPTSTTPKAGDVAVKTTGTYGHVGFVAKVNADGSYVTEEYNWSSDRTYHVRTNRVGDGHFNYFIRFK